MLVHGEAAKMEFLKQKVMQEFGVNCFMPANGETVTIPATPTISADMSRVLFKRSLDKIHGWCGHDPLPDMGVAVKGRRTCWLLI